MIQRIQSVYLSLTVLISLLLLKGSFLVFFEKAGSVIKVTFNGLFRETDGQGIVMIEKLFPLSVIIALIPVLSLITIFFFKKRNIQIWLSKILIGLVSCFILLSCYYSYLVKSEYSGNIIPGIKMVLPLLLLIFSILAFRGIRKDDQLVKSYDRLR
jgi:Domain of unknown function (DUF4293)